ncbi:pimeloyl-ACP methyl ester carboxylesterase [Shimia isoporae]|uniref:Pimeloyl-ACP methyl ester carboxylesterase n=1 Tax=Shimia isoporae TaxID=647720 RepID=A0A4V2Q3X2_9RHOB|nr:alpha/beta hydrolase [Shimia isoporae]TCL08820.1 pimeloyl-ACP methyl ester carboxylesterase [Shimia isoporae]
MKAFPELVGSLYEAAADPAKFDRLLRLAEAGFEKAEDQVSFSALRTAWEAHIARAEDILTKFPMDPTDTETNPAFDLERNGRVARPNKLAQRLMGLKEGDLLCQSYDVESSVLKALAAYSDGGAEFAPALRLPREDNGKLVHFVVRAIPSNGTLRLTGVEAAWHQQASRTMQFLYGLTPSETEVLGFLCEGHSPAETAEKRQRSIETIRQQIRAMIDKTHAQGLSGLIQLGQATTLGCTLSQSKRFQNQESEVFLSDGRRLVFIEQGPRNGRPVVFLHGCLGGNRLPKSAENCLFENNLRWIAPARPWHGRSEGHTSFADRPTAYSNDLFELFDHLDLSDVSLVGYDVGAAFALLSASNLASRLAQVVCVGPTPPTRGLRDFADAPMAQRILAMAAKTSEPLLRYLAVIGDRKIRAEGPQCFAATVFADSTADLVACQDEEILEVMWQGHHFHVLSGNEGFINDCRLIASDWSKQMQQHLIPVSVVHGGRDKIASIQRVRKFACELKAPLSIVENAGHSLAFSHTKNVLDHIAGGLD